MYFFALLASSRLTLASFKFLLTRTQDTLIPGNRGQIHGQQGAGLGEIVYADHGARRAIRAHLFDIGPVHGLEILDVLEEDIDVQDMLQI